MSWEPRIDVEEVLVQAEPTQTELSIISVAYRVRANDSRFNLVYPFYLTRENTSALGELV